jgi:hypothetical protein
MEKPFKIFLKEIPLNYSWMPFPQKLTINPMLLGKTINSTDERFTEYIENVEKWDNELFWKNTDNCSFDSIAVNKSQKPIAATITMINRGKIHFLPKTTKISRSKAIKLLIDLATKEEKEEHPWLYSIASPEINQNEKLVNCSSVTFEKCRNLFSVDDKKITEAVHLILEAFGIKITQTPEFDPSNLKNNIFVQIVTTKGKVEPQNTEINKIVTFIEKQGDKRKIIVIANTFKELPIKKRTNKEQLDHTTKLFFETNNTLFLTTLSLYNLWVKVSKGLISIHEASSLIQNQSGEIQI